MRRYSRLLALVLTLALGLATSPTAGAARADDYPSRPIRLIVPYAAGGGADSVARIVARRVGETIGQPIVIENRGGAGAIIGTEFVNKSEPDGYTLLLGQSGPISINPAVYKRLPYDPLTGFSPITKAVIPASTPLPGTASWRRPIRRPPSSASSTRRSWQR
ncbi:MAG: tripartite tricarboxylate transporter substrate-binding protein [Bradyrhizobium sp.]